MKIIVNNENFIIKNENFSPEDLSKNIDSFLQKGLILSHLEIDGKVIYDDYLDYIQNNKMSIDTVIVVFKTLKEHLNEMMLTANEYLLENIKNIESLLNEFYQGPTSEAWGGLEHLFDALQWLAELVNYLNQNKTIYSSWNQTITLEFDFKELLENLNQAVSNSDAILIGDVLSYELIPMFQSIQKQIQTVIDSEVKRNDLN